MSAREPAWRMLCRELAGAVEEERGDGERAASYLLSPMGARVNRALLVGTISPAASLGKEESQPFLRASLSDPTGSVNVTAGSFQPRALSQLRSVAAPQRVLVVGKVNLYRGRDSTAYVSLRAEAIRPIDESEYREALAEAVDQGLTRLELTEAARAPSAAGPAVLGVVPLWRHGATVAAQRYPSVDLGPLREGLRRALDEAEGHSAPPAESPVTVRPIPAAPSRPAPSAAERAEESTFMEIVDRLSEEAVDGYADLKEAFALAAGLGMTSEHSEELLNRLEESGAIEEPIVGKLRRA